MKRVDIHNLLNKISLLFKNKIFVTITIILMLIPWILLSLEDETINNIKENRYNVSNNKVSYTNVPTALNNFYSKLKYPDTYVYSTNKFLCTGTNINCINSEYTNIGLINKDEYNKIQGYLNASKSYWTMSEETTNVYKITSNGIELENSSNPVAIRPSIYLQGDLRITGSGTPDDPYIIKEKTTPDTQILALYVNGVKTDTLPTTKYYELTSYVCNKAGVAVSWLRNTRQLVITGLVSAPLQCSLYFDSYTTYADASGANSPMLASNMIPITWDGTKWVKADVMSAWYDYPTQKWANAVVVTAASRSTYLNAAAGTPITEADVLAYYVWIPRYAYKITGGYHTATPGAIHIEFLIGTTNINKNNIIVATTPTYSGSAQTNYVLHPAFNFGGTQVQGIWVSKFEMTGTITTPCGAEACSTAPITSKPYLATSVQTSVRSQTIGSFYYASRSMERAGNEYGFLSSEVDTHMIKNTEWGMVAYLVQSQYGKGSEVWVNKNNTFYTGCSGADAKTYAPSTSCNIYSSALGVNASTTGNVYGIYDMAGGSYEYVMASIANLTGGDIIPANVPNKYIDRYTDGYNSSMFGDAMYETSSAFAVAYTPGTGAPVAYAWYSNFSATSTTTISNFPHFSRGGNFNSDYRYYYNATRDQEYWYYYNSGLFASYGLTGNATAEMTSRFTLIVGQNL